MNKKLIILIGSLFFVKINVLAMTTDSVLELIKTLPIIQSDGGSEFKQWESTYDYLKKLEFNEDARKIIVAIAQKYDKNTLPKAGKEIINSVVKKGADDLLKQVEQHEFMLKNRKIRILSDFIVKLNGINAIIEISNLGLDAGLKDYIALLEFGEDSCETILSVVALFSTYTTFPGKIFDAIVAFMKKAAQNLTKDAPGAEDSIGVKQLYNNKIDDFLQFVEKLKEKKQNLIHVKLPSKVVIPAAWESSVVLKKVKGALIFIKNSVNKIDELKSAELTPAKDNIEPYLNSLSGNIGPKGAITNYLNSEDGKADEDFRAILMKAKKILEKWYGEGAEKSTSYHKLWEYLNQHRPVPKPPSPDVPPALPLRPSPLKDKLVLLKTNLSQLKVKLQLLSTKLVQIKEGLEAAVPLGDFVNDVSWWNKAIKSGSIGNNKDRIIVKWNEFSGGFNPKLARKWVMDNVLNDAKKILFFKKLNEISDKILGKEQIAILDKIISAIEAEE